MPVAVSPGSTQPMIALVEAKRIAGEHVGQRRGDGLLLRWSNGEECFLSSELLRKHCPCATCLAKRGDTTHEKPLTAKRSALTVIKAEAVDELDLVELWPVGNYALGMSWGDKHDTGIYSFTFLRELAEEEQRRTTTSG